MYVEIEPDCVNGMWINRGSVVMLFGALWAVGPILVPKMVVLLLFDRCRATSPTHMLILWAIRAWLPLERFSPVLWET